MLRQMVSAHRNSTSLLVNSIYLYLLHNNVIYDRVLMVSLRLKGTKTFLASIAISLAILVPGRQPTPSVKPKASQ